MQSCQRTKTMTMAMTTRRTPPRRRRRRRATRRTRRRRQLMRIARAQQQITIFAANCCRAKKKFKHFARKTPKRKRGQQKDSRQAGRGGGGRVKGKVPQGNNNWIAVAFVPCLAWQEPKKWSRVATSKRTSRSAKTGRKSDVRADRETERRRCNRNRGYPNQIAWNACGE